MNSWRINHKSVYFTCKEGKRIHDREKQLVLIYFDFKKIFDNISHNNFISKFRKQASKCYKVSENCLNDHNQRVVPNEPLSWNDLLTGGPSWNAVFSSGIQTIEQKPHQLSLQMCNTKALPELKITQKLEHCLEKKFETLYRKAEGTRLRQK